MAKKTTEHTVTIHLADPHDEKVNPKHYSDFGDYAPNIVIRTWIKIGKRDGLWGFYVGQILRYLGRGGLKPGEELLVELKKARWYLDEYIQILEEEGSE